MRTTDKPFSIRPTDGTALQRIRDSRRAKGLSMKPVIEQWAAEHEKREQEERKRP